MTWWKNLKAWAIRKLGGHAELPPEPKPLVFRHEQPSFLPLDRPFDFIDWERLVTMPQRERLYFEWLAHRIRHLDAKATTYKVGSDGDRDRLVYLARRDEIMRSFQVGREAAEKVAQIMNNQQKVDRLQGLQKGMTNHG